MQRFLIFIIFKELNDILTFSPQNFSAAGPFKASISGDSDLRSHSSPPLTLSLENGAASQPIRTPARVKKVKGHQRWRENGTAIGHHHNFLLSVEIVFFFLSLFTPPRGVKRPLFKDLYRQIIAEELDVVTIFHKAFKNVFFCHNSTKLK